MSELAAVNFPPFRDLLLATMIFRYFFGESSQLLWKTPGKTYPV